MRNWVKWGIILALVAGLGSLPLLFNGERGAKAPGPAAGAPGPPGGAKGGGPPAFAMGVEVVPVEVGLVTEDAEAVGTLEANESVIIRPEIVGRVTRVNFEEGQQVKKGTILVELDSDELEAQLAQSEADLEIAALNYNRMKQLIVNGTVSQQELDQASTRLKSARANQALYKERLSKTRLRAPFTGYLGTRLISPGDYVEAGRDVVNLEDIGTLKTNFMVPEVHLSRLEVGQAVEVRVGAFPGRIFKGKVYALDPRVDEVTRSIRVRARIPNPGAQLRPGMFAQVRLVFGYNEQALLIPEEAVVPRQGKSFVFVVRENRAALTEVVLGTRQRAVVQVLSGLEAGEVVVRAGQQKIRDGMPVRPVGRS